MLSGWRVAAWGHPPFKSRGPLPYLHTGRRPSLEHFSGRNPTMHILIACEFSGLVRDAFRARGHTAVSCDLTRSERGEPHLQCDVLEVVQMDMWDMVIAFPPCTHLCSSGARWHGNSDEMLQAVEFVRKIWNAPAKKLCIENPVGALSTWFRSPDQYIQPWQFGHGETKKTGLWLRNLPPLVPTREVSGRRNRVHMMPPSRHRQRERSRTYIGVALAMAEQWG